MLVIPANTNGIKIIATDMLVYGHDDAPHGHMHLSFNNVVVPETDMLLGEGRGFANSGLFFPLVLGFWWKRAIGMAGALANMIGGFGVGFWYLYMVQFGGMTPW